MAEILLKNVCKSFGNSNIIENLTLNIQDGKFTVLVGPSGCGKTTLLRMIAGIGPATSGEIFMDGENISEVAPGKRGVAMVFQNYAIYPTMSVKKNIEFGLKNNKVPKEERERLIREVSETVGLTPYLDRKPNALSGGQRQRVALARAMVKKPKVFLMDEPLSNLDAKLRSAMRSELIELHKRLKTSFVYVTHDQVEAMSMADHIVLMDKGIIQQQGAPEMIYNDPNNIFTAQFIGTPPMNILSLGNEGVKLGFRPEKVHMSYETTTMDYQQKGVILTREMLGSETIYKVALDSETIMVKSVDSSFSMDEAIVISVEQKNLLLFDKDGNRIRNMDSADYQKSLQLVGGTYNA